MTEADSAAIKNEAKVPNKKWNQRIKLFWIYTIFKNLAISLAKRILGGKLKNQIFLKHDAFTECEKIIKIFIVMRKNGTSAI